MLTLSSSGVCEKKFVDEKCVKFFFQHSRAKQQQQSRKLYIYTGKLHDRNNIFFLTICGGGCNKNKERREFSAKAVNPMRRSIATEESRTLVKKMKFNKQLNLHHNLFTIIPPHWSTHPHTHNIHTFFFAFECKKENFFLSRIEKCITDTCFETFFPLNSRQKRQLLVGTDSRREKGGKSEGDTAAEELREYNVSKFNQKIHMIQRRYR